MPKAASFGAELMNSAIGAGAPWYTSGSHMWNGAAPSLKATPAIMNTAPVISSTRSSECGMASRMTSRCRLPVAP
ncbi:hypothetical protein G6F35_018598 [Rhizopus arrhizus]|nr:hypothetical protein G6F35_018598 [Rhizopus arrhizus]